MSTRVLTAGRRETWASEMEMEICVLASPWDARREERRRSRRFARRLAGVPQAVPASELVAGAEREGVRICGGGLARTWAFTLCLVKWDMISTFWSLHVGWVVVRALAAYGLRGLFTEFYARVPIEGELDSRQRGAIGARAAQLPRQGEHGLEMANGPAPSLLTYGQRRSTCSGKRRRGNDNSPPREKTGAAGVKGEIIRYSCEPPGG